MTSPTLKSLPAESWPAAEGHVPSLDGLRAISISVVLIGHMVLPAKLVGVSAFGVLIFFFISGFLITRLLLAESKRSGEISLSAFYVRRFLRLYPVLIVYMILTISIVLLRGETFAYVDALSVFFYFVNYLLVSYETVGQGMTLPIGVLWSLSVEEHFYLFAPLALVFVRCDAGKMLKLAIAVCVLSLGLRLAYAHWWPGIVDTLLIYRHSETRFDAIAFGVVLACLAEDARGRRIISLLSSRYAFMAGVIVLLISFAIRGNYFQNTWRFTMQELALFPIMVGAVFAQPIQIFNRVLNSAPFVWIGRLSYSLYVWHGGVIFLFGWWLSTVPHFAVSSLELALTLMLAVISYYVVEQPALRLRKRFGHPKPAVRSSAIEGTGMEENLRPLLVGPADQGTK